MSKGPEAGEPCGTEGWTDAWRTHCSAAEVSAVSLHAARHSSVTLLRDAGVADHLVAAWHGHDEVVMRRTYSHAHREALAAAGDALAEAHRRSALKGSCDTFVTPGVSTGRNCCIETPDLLAPPTGLEPVTLRLTVECSAN